MTTAQGVPITSTRKLNVFALTAYALSGWFLAAMLVRLLGTDFLRPGTTLLPLVFLFGIPLGIGFVLPLRPLFGMDDDTLFKAAVYATSVALICDAVAITWFPGLYGLTPGALAVGLALIIWGAGWGQLYAFLRTRRNESPHSAQARSLE